MKLKLDLHDIFNRNADIERALNDIIRRFLDQREIKSLYHRIEKDPQNFGRIFVHFRHNRPR